MGLLTDLRELLQHVQDRRITLVPDPSLSDLGALRRLLITAAADSRADGWLEIRLRQRGDELLTDLALQLQQELEIHEPAELSAALISATHDFIAWRFQSGSYGARESMIEGAFTSWEKRDTAGYPAPWRYATELNLLRSAKGRLGLLAPGEVLLRLIGADAARWLVTLELLSSLDRDDPWRGHASLAEYLSAKSPIELYDHESEGAPWPWDNPTLERWCFMGLLRSEPFRDEIDKGERLSLTEFGHQLLGELLTEHDTPLKSLARAMLEDTSSALVDAAPFSSRKRASGQVIRHTRMVAHELRNALIPVRYEFNKLWEQLPRDELRVTLHGRQQKILGGIDRALRFVNDAAKAIDAVDNDTSSFELLSALRDACASVEESEGIAVELQPPDPPLPLALEGTRARLVMVFMNLFRNAAQAGGAGVKILATVRAAPGHQLVITIDDSGPGIPEERRQELFTARRPAHDGGGHGLPLVREVIEDEYGGSVHHDPSPLLGGARFTLRLPLPQALS